MVGAEPDSFPEGEGTDAGFSEVDGREGEEPDSSAQAEGTDAVEAEESTERREGVDGMTGKDSTRSHQGRGKEVDVGKNVIPLGGALGGSLINFSPFSLQIAGISNKKEEVGSACGFPRLSASI